MCSDDEQINVDGDKVDLSMELVIFRIGKRRKKK